jgi:hypothetical protein
MARWPERAPGDAAPAAGTYEQHNIFGSPTGIRVNVSQGQSLPAAPRGHSWVQAEDDIDER